MATPSRSAAAARRVVLVFLLVAGWATRQAALAQTGQLPPPSVDGNLPAPAAGLWENPPAPASVAVWGILGLRSFPYGEQVASNGVEFRQLFSLDLDFNLMLWRRQGLYLFLESRFWGQKAAPGITNPAQGPFDFSKREFDFTPGLAWNYAGFWEARFFAYSFNNLNRGDSLISPYGFNDGIGLENRYYLAPTYADLGTSAFDKARATFLSVGYYPSKSMVDGAGVQFYPGPFARAYLIWDLLGEWCYLFGDFQILGTRGFQAKQFYLDAGLAVRPFTDIPRLEFRVGSEDTFDLQSSDIESSAYLSVRYIY
jgi:hypothetical protein